MSIRKSDYESYDYRKFWEDGKRLYEDKSERIALRKFLAKINTDGKVFVDLGCGYGRLFNEYMNFETIVLVDYSVKNLKNARSRIRNFLKYDEKKLESIYFIAADVSNLPLKTSCSDVILTVRVVHHLGNPQKYFNEVRRILKNNGIYILEFANKRNFKNIFRFMIKKMDVSPFNLIPSQVGETILNYHPKYIIGEIKKRGFSIDDFISVSNFRISFLKKYLGVGFLVFLEKVYQNLFSYILLGPSIFLKATLKKGNNLKSTKLSIPEYPLKKMDIEAGHLLICPICKTDALNFRSESIFCSRCKKQFVIEDGIYNFKE